MNLSFNEIFTCKKFWQRLSNDVVFADESIVQLRNYSHQCYLRKSGWSESDPRPLAMKATAPAKERTDAIELLRAVQSAIETC